MLGPPVRERVLLRGGYFTEAIDRARAAVDELRASGDRRRYIASAPAFVETVAIDLPEEALKLAIDAAETAIELGDVANAGPLALAICDTALEAEADDVLDRWLPALTSTPLDATRQIEASSILTIARGARSRSPLRIERELLEVADRYRELGDLTRACSPELGAVCSLVWTGLSHAARSLFDSRVRAHLPPPLAMLCELVLRELEGPPWKLEGLELLENTTLHHYDRALLHLLREERADADALFRERYADRKRTSGSARQRFSPYFPGALISALGPPDTEPDVEWLLGWIHRPPFPGVWVAHRAICALLLSEATEPPEPGLAATAKRLVTSTDADDSLVRWVCERAERSGT
jgi:hypothetical protein